MNGRRTISTEGGRTPRWHPEGGELFYWSEGGLVSASIDADSEFRASLPLRLFKGSYQVPYSVLPSGDRFVMVEVTGGARN